MSQSDHVFYPYAVMAIGPRRDWPNVTDHVYACMIENVLDAFDEYSVIVLGKPRKKSVAEEINDGFVGKKLVWGKEK